MIDCLPGDRICLVQMSEDPNPIEPGAKGTVDWVQWFSMDDYQIRVRWDNHRSLMLIASDEFAIIERPRAAYFQEAINGLDR